MGVRLRRVAGNLLLSVAALLGVACLVAMVLLPLLGLKPLVVRSGSMEPAIGTGSIAWARQVDAEQIRVGEVVVVQRADSRVMHRVVGIEKSDGAVRRLQLRGDANAAPDAGVDEVTSVQRVVFHVPWVGRVVAAAVQPPGSLLWGAYLALCLWLVIRPNGTQTAQKSGLHRASGEPEGGAEHAGA